MDYFVYWLKPFPLVKNIDIVNSPPGGTHHRCKILTLILSDWPVRQLTKVVWLTTFLDKKKTFFIWHFWLASQHLTSKFNSIKVPLSNIMTFISNSISHTIILPFKWTTITVDVVSKVISDIIGSYCRLISLLCKILKGITMYFSPIIHNINMDFIIWLCQDIVEYNNCLNYCSDIVRILINVAIIKPPSVGQYTQSILHYSSGPWQSVVEDASFICQCMSYKCLIKLHLSGKASSPNRTLGPQYH